MPCFEHIGLAVELLRLLALGDERAGARLGVEAGNAPARAHPLGQRALRREIQQLAREILPLELLVLADIGGVHLTHLLRAQQLADALIVDAALFEAKTRSFTPDSWIALSRRSGRPHRPKPPDAISIPSKRSPSSADAASG
jgi:hypothetical protein